MTDIRTKEQQIVTSARQALALTRGRKAGSDAHRRSFATAGLSEAEAAAIASSRMSSEHDHLDAVLDEEPSADERNST